MMLRETDYVEVFTVKTHKKLISIFLSAVMLLTVFSAMPFSALSEDNSSSDYAAMISYFQQHMKQRETDISYTFTTTLESYVDDYKNENVRDLGNVLYNTVFFDIFKDNYSAAPDPYLCDYLYNSVNSAAVVDSGYKTHQKETGTEYEFKIEFKFGYYSTAAEERAVQSFVAQFSRMYLNDNMSDYQKVKTIYDFVVRNATYDFDVFHNKFALDSDRYRISHSAYGAIYGNLLKDGKSEADYKLDYETVLSGEKIQTEANQGLAVCEGYSKLFYAVCTYNGIPCRIVDGDNTESSGKETDPHEWNFVYLDDGVKADGARWYQIDTTFASQVSIKEIHMNSYDYFLKGSGNKYLSEAEHQQPYKNFGLSEKILVKEQLYDWYAPENISSVEDYEIPATYLDATLEAKNGYIIRRITDYGVGKGEQIAYIYTDLEKSFLIAVDENHNVVMEEVEGFDYTGIYSRFDVLLPYMIPDIEYHVASPEGGETVSGTVVNSYDLMIVGADNSSVTVPFKIVPRDMSNREDNYSIREIQEVSPYTGNVIEPELVLVDGYDNTLVEGRDFNVNYYTDSEETTPAVLKNMGTYWCDISFFGNYCGDYVFSFSIGKADLSYLTHNEVLFEYLPKLIRQREGVSTVASMYKKGAGSLNISGLNVYADTDYTISANGNLNWGSSGTITLTGVSSSSLVKGGTSTTFSYQVNQKFDLTKQKLDGKALDTGVYYYTGSAVIPSGTNGLDSILEKGVDYKIVSYSNNVNAGEAKAVIEGIGGCTGRIEMTYYIHPLNIGTVAKLENIKLSNGTLSYTVKHGDKTLVRGTDYTDSVKETSTGYTISITGKGNYTATYNVNLNVTKPSNPSTPSTPTVPTTVITVKKSAISKLTAKKKSIVVKWKAVSGNVTGYRIEYSTSSNFKKGVKTVNVKGAKKTSYTIKKLKSRKKYYVRIRTYYKKGNTIYLSSWSKAKSTKAK